MKKRILYCDNPIPSPGGGQLSLLTLLRGIDRTKIDPVVFIPEENPFFRCLEDDNIPCRVVPGLQLWQAIKALRPDIIHCNAATTRYSFYAALSAYLLRIPFIWHVRVTASAGWKDMLLARLAMKIIVISSAVDQKFRWIRCQDKIVKIFNAVDTQKFRPGLDVDYLCKELSLRSDQSVVGIFSRLISWKGHGLFLDAAKIVHDRFPSAQFIIVGEGASDYQKELVERARQIGLADCVRFLGFREDIPQLMNLCRVIVNPSVEAEAFGRILIEGMACGKPVIATRVGGHPEIMDDQVNGVLVAPDPADLARAVEKILGDARFAQMISSNGLKKVETHFSVGHHVLQMEALYQDVLTR
jgi:glycosyltransferase involved in cell wall biosynthesis